VSRSAIDAPFDLERAVARLITAGTYLSVALIAAGVILMAAAGRSPLAAAPPLDPATFSADIASLRPEPFLWLGLIAAIGTPTARVVASLIGYLGRGERAMAGISVAILGVIAVGVAVALLTGAGLRTA
jgi:uncharacterized membrane protein